jgi:hypothetical protein
MLVELDDPNVIRNLVEKVSSHIKRTEERDRQVESDLKLLTQRLSDIEGDNAVLKEENLDLKEQLAKQMVTVESVGRDAGRLVTEIGNMAANMDGLKSLMDILPGKIKMPKIKQAKMKNKGFPVTSPVETCESVIAYLGRLVDDPEMKGAVKTVSGRMYVDLGDQQVREGLPYGLSAAEARDTLRRARLAKRPTQDDLAAIGWTKMPSFGVVIET